MLKKIPEIITAARLQLNVITAKEAVAKCHALKGIMIDVREPAEYAQKAAANTVNIPRGVLEMKMLELHPNEDLAIFIHCATGARATLSAEQLLRVGYKNVWVIVSNLDDVCNACC